MDVSLSGGTSHLGNIDDWKIWMIHHGNFEMAAADVCGVGESIRVKCVNMFNLLSRVEE